MCAAGSTEVGCSSALELRRYHPWLTCWTLAIGFNTFLWDLDFDFIHFFSPGFSPVPSFVVGMFTLGHCTL